MSGPEVEAFLSNLATVGKDAASTQNQALSALLFLYRKVLQVDLPWMDGVVRAKRLKHAPVVLTETEVRSLLAHLDGTRWLVVSLLYSSGARLLESLRLRVKEPTIQGNGIKFYEALRAAGGSAEVVDLPKIGIKGNSHMIMMDRNSDVIAGVVQDRLVKRGFYR